MTIAGSLFEDSAPPAPATEALVGERKTDFLVIGAGMTGLSAALRAADRGIDTTVIEVEVIGEGGSGRNHGHCVPEFGYIDPAKAVARLGKARGEAWTDLLVRSGEEVFRLIRTYGIDCEAAPTGTLHVAHNAAAVARIVKQHAFYERLGRRPVLLERKEVERLTGSRAYFGGWIHPDGGHLNPLAFTRGLARAAIGVGATVFTGTRAIDIKAAGGRWLVTTPKGRIDARIVAICTNAYTGRLAWPLGATYFPMACYTIASEPLDPAIRQTILPGNHNVGDTRPDVRYYRFDAANRLIVGGLIETRRGADVKWTQDHMTRRMTGLFPQIGPIVWKWYWTGWLCINLDRRPHLYNPAKGLYALIGYSGRGVPTATTLGEVLAQAATGRPAEELPMEIFPMRRLPGMPLLTFFVPKIRGPFNRLLSAIWC